MGGIASRIVFSKGGMKNPWAISDQRILPYSSQVETPITLLPREDSRSVGSAAGRHSVAKTMVQAAGDL